MNTYPEIIINPPDNQSLSNSDEFSSEEIDASLTERNRKYVLKIPIKNWEAQQNWQKAFLKLRSVYLLNKIREDINLYGTNSELFDIYGNYKENLEEIMQKKVKIKDSSNQVVVYKPKIFMPNSAFYRYWNLLSFILLLYVAFIMPSVMAFTDSFEIGIWFTVDILINVCFSIEIIINLNTAYKNKEGSVITCRKKIFFNYLKGFLIPDIISIIPLYHITGSITSRLNSLIRLLRLLRFGHYLKIIQKFPVIKRLKSTNRVKNISIKLRSYGGFWRLAALIFLVISLTHCMACMWYFAARIYNTDYNTWIVKLGFLDDSIYTIYIRGLYFAITVLATVGFGDIKASTVAEMFLVICWMLIGMTFYSILVGTLSSVISMSDSRDSIIDEKMEEIEKFSKDFEVKKEIVKKMKKFVRKEGEVGRICDKDRIGFIEELPADLRYQVAMEMFEGACSKINFFLNKDRIFISDVIPKLYLKQVEKSSLVYSKNSFAENVYFIVQGRVNYLISKNEIIFKTIMCGSYFGEIELIERISRKFSVASETYCEFLIMSNQVFEYVLKEYPRIGTSIVKSAEKRNMKNQNAIKDYIKALHLPNSESEEIQLKEKKKHNISRFWFTTNKEQSTGHLEDNLSELRSVLNDIRDQLEDLTPLAC